MRNLTVLRKKTFVASLTSMKVYIEDQDSGELTINNVPCRKLGELKNGEEQTFSIDEKALKVFVIAGLASKDYCYDVYQLDEGQEDVHLSGQNEMNAGTGNAFRFDNNHSEYSQIAKRKGSKIGLIVFITFVLLGAVIGALIGTGILIKKAPVETKFSSNGITITLTSDFQKVKTDNLVTLGTKEVVVMANKETFSGSSGLENVSVDQYYDALLKNIKGADAIEDKKSDEGRYVLYDFTNPETNDTYRYYTFVYKTDDAFWIVQFASLTKYSDKYSKQFLEWAKQIEFEKSN